MISEREIADGFHSFWEELFPFLTPDFVRVFNGTHAMPILDNVGIPLSALPLAKDVRHHDIVAEVAFHLAREAIQKKIVTTEVIVVEASRRQAVDRTRELLLRVHEGREDDFALSDGEWSEVRNLLWRYSMFFENERTSTPEFEFEPAFPGLGFLGPCHGDLSAGRVIYEVKTVSRNLHSRDFRQLFLYLALQAATGHRRWDIGGFLNPRRGLVYRFHVEELFGDISGGKTGIEIFDDIASFLCSRDVELDRSF